ncbi:hypothetical protein C8R47DRAFT_1069245 [Mycena vitilis]|nr:hypothetical protein C8R47DRAFT_1069245 [Mycena vitilis]
MHTRRRGLGDDNFREPSVGVSESSSKPSAIRATRRKTMEVKGFAVAASITLIFTLSDIAVECKDAAHASYVGLLPETRNAFKGDAAREKTDGLGSTKSGEVHPFLESVRERNAMHGRISQRELYADELERRSDELEWLMSWCRIYASENRTKRPDHRRA